MAGNGGCEHECVNIVGSFYCKCYSGFELAENGVNCIGIFLEFFKEKIFSLHWRPRCPCLSRITDSQLANLQQIWRKALTQLEAEFYEKNNKYPTFSLLALSKLKIGIDNLQPLEQLFLSEFPLLNRQGNCFWVVP